MEKLSTKDLVEELSKREAVQEIVVEPYDKFEIKIKDQSLTLDIDSGPCRILVIWD